MLARTSFQYLISLSLKGYVSRLMTFLERVQNLTEPFTGGTFPSLDLITSIARTHSWMLFLVNAVDVLGSSLLMMVSRFSRRFTSVSSSPVICSAFVLASLTLLVYVFNLSNSWMEREMTPKMVPATSAMRGVRKVRRWDEATTRKLARWLFLPGGAARLCDLSQMATHWGQQCGDRLSLGHSQPCVLSA